MEESTHLAIERPLATERFSAFSDTDTDTSHYSGDYSNVISFLDYQDDTITTEEETQADSDIDTIDTSFRLSSTKYSSLEYITPRPPGTPPLQLPSPQSPGNIRPLIVSQLSKPYYAQTIADLPSPPPSLRSSRDTPSLSTPAGPSSPTQHNPVVIFPTPPSRGPNTVLSDLTRSSSKSAPTPGTGNKAGHLIDENLLSAGPHPHLSSHSASSSFVCIGLGPEFEQRDNGDVHLKSLPEEDDNDKATVLIRPSTPAQVVQSSNCSIPWTQPSPSTQSLARVRPNADMHIKGTKGYPAYWTLVVYISLDIFLILVLAGTITIFLLLRVEDPNLATSIAFLIASIALIAIEAVALLFALRLTVTHRQKRQQIGNAA